MILVRESKDPTELGTWLFCQTTQHRYYEKNAPQKMRQWEYS